MRLNRNFKGEHTSESSLILFVLIDFNDEFEMKRRSVESNYFKRLCRNLIVVFCVKMRHLKRKYCSIVAITVHYANELVQDSLSICSFMTVICKKGNNRESVRHFFGGSIRYESVSSTWREGNVPWQIELELRLSSLV